jgi:hypothetical protein
MAREYASPELANLIATRLAPEEFERRVRAPLTDAEAQDVADLVGWFSRRYPTAKERLAYARRKLRQYASARGPIAGGADYLATAKHLAEAHRKADPETELVFLDPDPTMKEIRLLEVTRKAPTTGQPFAVGFAARPDLGISFPSTVLVLSPEEWDAARAAQVALPDGFSINPLQPL